MLSISNKEFWLISQITDSGFPGGALAHSQGLESALFHGFLKSLKDEPEKELLKFVNMSLIQVNSQLIPILLDTWKLSYNININCNEWLKNISLIDEKCHLALNNNVSRRASINQGKCFLRASKEALVGLG